MTDDFLHELHRHDPDALSARIAEASVRDVDAALRRLTPTPDDLIALLSPAAAVRLETMARRAHELTVRHFGRTIQLFAPLYLSNVCANRCRYCGFHADRRVPRRTLAPDEIDAEARALAATGLRQVLALTGEAPRVAGPDYLVMATEILRRYFPSVGVEVYALSREDYARLVDVGVESMTMFQETYNPALYASLHPSGPKADFAYRVDAPSRAAAGGIRTLGLGALLGLDDWRRDVYWTAMHARWLERRFPGVSAGFSLPRLRPVADDGGAGDPSFTPHWVDDRALVQAMTALRLFMPSAAITVSTREGAALRDRLLGLGVTRMSAGVSTAVGGYGTSEGGGASQFEIDDTRSVAGMVDILGRQGYQAVFKDWEPLGAEPSIEASARNAKLK